MDSMIQILEGIDVPHRGCGGMGEAPCKGCGCGKGLGEAQAPAEGTSKAGIVAALLAFAVGFAVDRARSKR